VNDGVDPEDVRRRNEQRRQEAIKLVAERNRRAHLVAKERRRLLDEFRRARLRRVER
jgi:hypothetical protein